MYEIFCTIKVTAKLDKEWDSDKNQKMVKKIKVAQCKTIEGPGQK